jgi:hypothetical protein
MGFVLGLLAGANAAQAVWGKMASHKVDVGDPVLGVILTLPLGTALIALGTTRGNTFFFSEAGNVWVLPARSRQAQPVLGHQLGKDASIYIRDSHFFRSACYIYLTIDAGKQSSTVERIPMGLFSRNRIPSQLWNFVQQPT